MSSTFAVRSLQQKVSVTLFIVMAALALLSYLTLQSVVAPAFDQLELDQATTNLVRAERAILNDLDNLNAIVGDWALWDDAYDYVRGEYPVFEDSNLSRPTLSNLGLNLLAIYDGDGGLLWGQVDDADQLKDIAALGVLTGDFHAASFLVRHTDPDGRLSGLLRTDLGPMMFSSWPVLRSNGSGPIAGTMIMGQLLDTEHVDVLRRRTEVGLALTPVGVPAETTPALDAPLRPSAAGAARHEVTPSDVVSSALLSDLFGQPLMVLEVRTPRRISALGGSTVDGALLFLGLAAVVVAVVTWMLLRQIIVVPLAGLASHIVSIRKSGDLTSKCGTNRPDEIGALSREFDRLTGELHEARKLLLDQSFKAGKADLAAEVLHNIRNAMTPMINSLDRLARNFDVSKKLKVRQALDELASGEAEPERAGKLLSYVGSAFSHIEASNQDAADNLGVASTQARQVEAILADQERHAKVPPLLEKLNLDEVLDEAVLVIPRGEEEAVELSVGDDLHHLSVRANRISLLQVMGNIILNAYESIRRSDTPHGRIGVHVTREMVDDRPMIRLIVRDNGGGFDVETGQKIFQRGFSSKQGNMSGLGLHWCANAVAGMGGRIRAESHGPGRGAEFHVLLPAAQGGPQ
ncbi:MAG: ATP-binding protein [Gammaproteobacteria bacterium]|nr:ATP-binding protein [Gammaproteobacteria bacterium]MDH5344909.1 ATP-binding protein [Gammaproteobacteria bacterium]